MLLHYHWGQGVGHAYSHVARTTIDSHGNPVSSPADSHSLASDSGDHFESIDPENQVEVPDIPDSWEDWDEDSNISDSSDSTVSQNRDSDSKHDSEDEMGTSSDVESIHPGVDVLEYDDYRY